MKFLCLALFFIFTSNSFALPFNDDLHDTQAIRTGEAPRMPVDGTVSIDAPLKPLLKKEDASLLINPQKGDSLSLENGKRLWAINCSPCHGTYSDDGSHEAGVVSKFLPAPRIDDPMYKDKSDGFFYGTIHFGGVAIMPAYGHKLSESEHWDIVNYVRKIQDLRR